MRTRALAGRSAAAMAVTVLLVACGVGAEDDGAVDGDDQDQDATATTDSGGEPIDIEAAVDASRDENTLVVYGNSSADQWGPVLDAFSDRYPWIEVETFDLGGTEAFQRYLSEEATGAATADVIINTVGYPEDLAEQQEAIQERWSSAFGR